MNSDIRLGKSLLQGVVLDGITASYSPSWTGLTGEASSAMPSLTSSTFTQARNFSPQRSISKGRRLLVYPIPTPSRLKRSSRVCRTTGGNKCQAGGDQVGGRVYEMAARGENRLVGSLECQIHIDVGKDVPSPPEGHPGMILAVHQRIPNGDTNGPASPRSTSLRQSRDTFKEAAARIFQHRSIAYVVRRRSTAVFTSRQTSWGDGAYGPSIGRFASFQNYRWQSIYAA